MTSRLMKKIRAIRARNFPPKFLETSDIDPVVEAEPDASPSTTFTAHPVRLPDGTSTMPELTWDMSQEPFFVASRTALRKAFGDDLSGKSILDLGCLEGGYTAEFARLGMNATGLEVRTSNFRNCEIVRKALGLPNLRFVQDDCWNIEKYGIFDVIFCSGLLYHLDNPVAFLKLMRKQCNLLILDTHFATEESTTTYTMSDIVIHEGLRGRWYVETPDGGNPKDDNAKWTAWGNSNSFWPMESEVVRAIKEAGFTNIDLDVFPTRVASQRQSIVAS